MLSENQLINIGFISKPSGFKGDLLFAFDNDDAEEYTSAKFFFIELEGKPVPFLAENIKLNGTSLIVKLQDVNTEEEAKKLTGKKLSIEKSAASHSEDELDWYELIGYQIIENTYGALGMIEHIEETTQQLIAKCTVEGKEVLFPLHEDFILEIDDEKKLLRIDLPEGLLDIYLK